MMRWNRRSSQEEERSREIRDRLHERLDALGDREPAPEEVESLVAMAQESFPGYTVAGRIIRMLARQGGSA